MLDGAVLFGLDSTKLRPEAREALGALAQDVADAGLREFRVVGHTDSSGADDYNFTLSEERALAVREYLGALPILANITITSEGRGESEPIADNTSPEGRGMNRRVEIIGN